MSRDDHDDQDLDQQMTRLAEQLTDDKVKAIADRLGLHRHEKARREASAPHTRDPSAPSISQREEATCSFCEGTREQVGPMVESKSGALICKGCIATMVARKLKE
ncbi:MAG: ClpX C4-type zinc finger protein [Oleiphilaceae bacterium]|nr:ClpX C4-type zinc finger protein [Oleiphilaceae bacterium]